MALAGLQRFAVQCALLQAFVHALPFLQENTIDVPSVANPHSKVCNEADYACWQQGLLPYNGHCYQPLKTGPCSEGFWLVLDHITTALRGYCAPHPCKATEIPYLDACLKQVEADSILCKGKHIRLNIRGQPYCSESSALSLQDQVFCVRNDVLVSSEEQRFHVIDKRMANPRDAPKKHNEAAKVTWVNSPSCSTTNDGNCIKEVETGTVGVIELIPE